MKRFFDLIIIVPLEEELKHLLSIFPVLEELSTELQFRVAVETGNAAVSALVVLQEDMGKGCASKACSSALREFDAGLLVCLGIAGGLSKDLKLGDVCYSRDVLDVYDNSKVSDSGSGEVVTKWSPTFHRTPRALTQALSFSRLSPVLKPEYEKWQKQRLDVANSLAQEPHTGRDGRNECFSEPQAVPGTLACAAVTDSPTYNARLLRMNRRLLAVETESGGVFEQADVCDRPVLVIRGISDYADPKKGELEQVSKGEIRAIAALNCASFLRLQINNPRFLKILHSIRTKQENNADLFDDKTDPDPTAELIKRIGEEVDSKLRELSPEYRLQPKGYRLPIPRIKIHDTESQSRVGRAGDQPLLDMASALKDRKRVLIHVPRTYPDQSLPWVISDELLTCELDGKSIVPIVIEGSHVSPPRSDFAHLSHLDPEFVNTDNSLQIVFIINGLPLESKTKTRFLIAELETWKNAKIIFLHRGDINLAAESDFVAASNSNIYGLCDISFFEISHFIQKNFEMTGPEAGVIALRLRKTFDQFKLSAHPTYFAGIPRETLSALLQANRRAELIQLAVDGFLTFLVAGDAAEIALSRTTRSRFLRHLAFQTRAQKRKFDRAQLISFTEQFAAEGDFEIDPIEFVGAFVEKGILHFEDDGVKISLPFIESYLLALELREKESDAISYFNSSDSAFDIPTFDIYSELGASEKIVTNILKDLAASEMELRSINNGPHILLGSDINPDFMRKRDRLIKLQDRVTKAIQDVQTDTGDLTEKQRLLDIAEQVERNTSQKTKNITISDQKSDAALKFENAVRVWAIGTALLGSGAEHLNAKTKRYLAKNLISLACLIIDHWTRAINTVDFDLLKESLTQDDFIHRLLPMDSDKSQKRELKNTVEMMVDVLEFNALSDPIRRMLNHLCEEAKHKVLGISIENAGSIGELEGIVQAAWLMDIDSKKGAKLLRDSFKSLSNFAFLRVNIAHHFLTRSYWSKSVLADRLAMLDAASDALKALGLSIETSEIKKIIKQDDADKADPDSMG